MPLVIDSFRKLIPPRSRSNSSNWISFNAPCCQHRGHKPDQRKRGGLKIDDGIVYNCFNCKFTASWQPGRNITEKFKNLCKWLGASQDDINQLIFEAIKTESLDYEPGDDIAQVDFPKRDLPPGSLSLAEWGPLIEGDIKETVGDDFLKVVSYLIERGYDNPFNHDFYWSPDPEYIDRVIIPFRWQGRIVGSTARKIADGKPKYVSDQPSNFLFNVDRQTEKQKYIFVCEGPFDALSIGGTALLTNNISDQQARILNSFNAEIIVIPDQDTPGLQLIERAIYYNFSVAFPNWGSDVKDVADAVNKYGKLFVVVDSIKTAQNQEIVINLYKKQLEKKLKYSENNG
jgi:hypothetical protein